MLNDIKTYSSFFCKLGESPIWIGGRNCFLWLDILNKCVFEKPINTQSKDYFQKWQFAYTPTAIIPSVSDPDFVWIVTDKGVYCIDLQNGVKQIIVEVDIPETHRTNDGSAGPDGTLYFGTMQWTPDGRNGKLYSFNRDGYLKELPIMTGIPNTFVWIDSSHVAISDSFYRKIDLYKADKTGLHHVEELYDFSSYGGEPDGGALDRDGMIWLALWDRGQIVCLDPTRKKITQTIDLPVSRPTSCCFGGPEMDMLFVTSAVSEDTDTDPQGGQCFILEMKTPGTAPWSF